MITKAIVEEVIDKYSARVRIPVYHQLDSASIYTPTSELPIAAISCPPGMHYVFTVGDIVFVEFQENQTNRPVIVGILDREKSTASTNISTNSLEVSIKCHLPNDTLLESGTKTASIIQYIEELQNQIDYLKNQLEIYPEVHVYGRLIESEGKELPTNEDLTLLNNYLSGTAQMNNWQLKAADLNNDGYINNLDSQLLSEYLSGGTGGRAGTKFLYRG